MDLLRTYGIHSDTLFTVVQHGENDFSLWIVDTYNGRPSEMTAEAVEAFMAENDTEGVSVRGSWSEVSEELMTLLGG